MLIDYGADASVLDNDQCSVLQKYLDYSTKVDHQIVKLLARHSGKLILNQIDKQWLREDLIAASMQDKFLALKLLLF